MKKVTPFLWFDGKAEEAMRFYTSLIPNSRVVNISYWPEGSPFPSNQVMMGIFELDGQQYYAFDAGPEFKFNESISLFIECESQQEIDRYWNSFTTGGGQESVCGWVKDRFGLSWQIVPSLMKQVLQDSNKDRVNRVMQVMMKMKKLILADLQAAYDNK